jgi:DNA ligase D-like protein (predicted 3'-phosphoesterase)
MTDMNAPLQDYKGKRDFTKTPEPAEGGENAEPFFVVQDHHASSHHHDFRLLLDGVLKSWAVPKGVPEQPKVKRLAVQTEDHPVAYGSFEGTIPPGSYGAGVVKIHDRGPFELIERGDSKIVVRLQGSQLNGTYALVRFKGKEDELKNWLIMRTH